MPLPSVLRAWHVGASGRSPIMGVRPDAPTIETIVSETFCEIITFRFLIFLREERSMTQEIDEYLAILDDLRGQVKKGLEGLDREALDWRPIPEEGNLSTNSLGAIATHLAGSETFWMKEIIAGQSRPPRPRGGVRGKGDRRAGTASEAGGSGPGYKRGLNFPTPVPA
ncbi:MAG: DUF664 domain-containing protein [Deltaproteobacteria bacterium]|nr:MAG: DUF664 domain-containing protein [Deltaproteobacteria bacterium]